MFFLHQCLSTKWFTPYSFQQTHKTAQQVVLTLTWCLQSSLNLCLLLMSTTDLPKLLFNPKDNLQVFVVLQLRKVSYPHPVKVSNSQNHILPVKRSAAEWTGSCSVADAFRWTSSFWCLFFFFPFCRVRCFCLTLQICPTQMKHYVKKKQKKNKTGFF